MRCLSPPNGTWKIYCGLILSVVSYNTVFLMTSSNDIHKFICDTAGWSLSQSATKSYSHFNVCVPSLFNGKEKYDFIPIRADAHFSIFTISSYFFFFLFPLFTILIPSWLHMFVMVSSRDNDDDVSTTMAMTEKRVNSLYANSHSHTSRKGKFFTYPSSIYSHCGYCEEWSIFPGVLRYE